jgi:hypothetical protein
MSLKDVVPLQPRPPFAVVVEAEALVVLLVVTIFVENVDAADVVGLLLVLDDLDEPDVFSRQVENPAIIISCGLRSV